MDLGEVRRVTVGVRDLTRSRALYADMLGVREVGEWRVDSDAARDDPAATHLVTSLGLVEPTALNVVDLEQPGTRVGAVRLIRVATGEGERINEGARPYDHGYVKNLDFFTDDVKGQYSRFVAAGFEFLAPPVDYRVPWGEGAVATEAHLPTEDGVKVSLAKMAGVPRSAMGRSGRETAFTEVAAATQVVKDFDRAEAGREGSDAAAYAPVCNLADLPPGTIREHRPADGSLRIAITKVGGEVFAFEDRCPHLGAPLSRGAMRAGDSSVRGTAG